ncbi:hypothetical protein J2S40_004188 [Nocardioides luteus]|uniref:Uncharacterized protein n=1 Tax=Nocardioides luteus TaxID=1844 RepID=A0ABQ5SPW4_9ACTN|nr:hypothetical protein [Nocardioides luteus]MDR7313130.1 hypothetical protein [Nocardioides luteus]GGR43901.1 hypothetical protein GCM10010197_06680 [Nocardioides luteus]GLJ66193.1 hypothetical protein GCM10017579_02290 [Nocardioides luteus]
MPTPLSSLLPQIVTLNVPDQPFSFFSQGRQIIGWWDIAKITSLYPTQATHVDEDYRLTVTLDELRGSFGYNEIRRSTEWVAGFRDGKFTLGGEKKWHSGNRIEKKWSYQAGGLNRTSVGGSQPTVGYDPAVYSFESSRIKDPLFTWLQSHGWRHKGFLGQFFAR